MKYLLVIAFAMFAAPVAAETCGLASWYGGYFHGRTTANGETYNMHELTAASRTLNFGTRVRVTYQGESVVVRINDRGPYVAPRIIDLSQAAAQQLGMIDAGVGRICYEIIE